MIDVLGALREGLAPHYTVEREIGAGGMARVFLAVERHPPRKVAVKVMNPDVSSSEFRERFIREVELFPAVRPPPPHKGGGKRKHPRCLAPHFPRPLHRGGRPHVPPQPPPH